MALVPTIIRACSMIRNIWRMPSCTPPTRVPPAGLSPPKVSSQVVEEVVGEVVPGAGDEPLDALDVPGAVRLLDRFGPAGPHVRAGFGLGQHHGAAPLAVDGVTRELLLLRGADGPQHLSEVGAAG